MKELIRNFFSKKPWYFIFPFLSLIGANIVEKIIDSYLSEDLVIAILDKSISIRSVFPIFCALVILIICLISYAVQLSLRQRENYSKQGQDTDLFDKVLNSVLKQDEYIESIQAFHYEIKNDNVYKFIKLQYLTGAINERIELNTILQTYYYFPHDIYKRIRATSRCYDYYIKEDNPDGREAAKLHFLEEGEAVCQKIYDILDTLESVEDVRECHSELYRVLVRLLSTISDEAIESALGPDKEKIEAELINRKKTGILGSIILNDLYIFRNQNSHTKNNRIYFTFPYQLKKKKNVILLAAIDGRCFPDNRGGAVEEYCKSFISRIYEQTN